MAKVKIEKSVLVDATKCDRCGKSSQDARYWGILVFDYSHEPDREGSCYPGKKQWDICHSCSREVSEGLADWVTQTREKA